MTPGTTAQLRRVLVAVLGGLVVGAGLLLDVPRAAADVSLITVDLMSVSITGSEPSDEVVMVATFSNTGEVPVYGLRYSAWRSRDPIQDLAALRQEVAASSAWGVKLYGNPESFGKVTEQAEAFLPGATAQVRVRATLAELGFDTPQAAYTVGVAVLGTTDGSAAFVDVGEGRTVVAVPGEEPVPVTRVVVLDAQPTKLTTGVFANEDLLTQLNGRLDALLDAALDPGMSYLIDPALLDEVTDMANGYQVRSGGELVPGTGQSVAAAWLSRFRQLPEATGAQSLFGNPDITGAAVHGDAAVLERALAAGAEAPRTTLPLVVLPTQAVHTAELDSYLAGSGADAVLATNAVIAGARQPSTTGLPVLTATSSLTADLPDAARARLLVAEAALAGTDGQLRLIREPAELLTDRAATTDWMQPHPLDELLAATPTAQPATFDATAVTTLDADQLGSVGQINEYLAAYGELVPESTIDDETTALLTRAVSSSWLGDEVARKAFLGELDELVGPKALARAVTLDASPRFVMSARANEFPMTVTNNLDEDIRVKVVISSQNPLRPQNPLRLTVPDTEVFTIPAGQSQPVNIRPEASANGVVLIDAWVATEGGQRVTPSTRITVEVTDLGMIGGIIILVSGAVVVGATVLRIRQMRRKAAEDAAEASPATEATDG